MIELMREVELKLCGFLFQVSFVPGEYENYEKPFLFLTFRRSLNTTLLPTRQILPLS